MAEPQQKPRAQANQTADKMAKVAAAAVATYFATAAVSAPLQQAGFSIARLSRMMAALYKPLVSARIYILRRRADYEFSDALPTDGPNAEQVQAFIQDEIDLEEKFVRRSSQRVSADLRRAADRGATKDELDKILQNALDRERRFNMMRQQAAERRLRLRIEEAQVEAQSPEGAYWVLDPTLRTHTADCMRMAGRIWSWSTLRRIRPSNRHAQCGCRLIPASLARANGLPGSDAVQSM